MKTTVLDCINRVPQTVESILENREKNLKPLVEKLGDKIKDINELVFIGSGSSSTCAMTSKGAVEKASGLRTSVLVPNEFYYDRNAFNKNALYIFTSQSGNSILTWECLRRMKKEGYMTVAITESDVTPMAKEADIHIVMGCGYEEYGFRTIGYCASVLTHILIAMKIGLLNGNICQLEYDEYIKKAEKLPNAHKEICKKTIVWFEKNKEKLVNSDTYIFYGGGTLWGVALEGALKTLEMSRKIAIGYEIEEGLHGPVIAFNSKVCVLSLNGGFEGCEKSSAIVNMTKHEFNNGFVIGANPIDETDLEFTPVSGEFMGIEFAPTVEIFAYLLTGEIGIDLTQPIKMPEEGYYEIHDENASK